MRDNAGEGICPLPPARLRHIPGLRRRGSYLEASLKALLEVLGRIRPTSAPTGLLSRLHPGVLALGALGTILSLAWGRDVLSCSPCLALLLLQAFLLPRRDRGRLLATAGIASAAALLISTPALFLGYQVLGGASLFAVRAGGSAAAAVILARSVPPHDLIGRLGALRLSPGARMILDQTIRALFLLGESARELLEALAMRSFGGKRRFVPVAWLLGALFLRTTELSRRTGEALVARGYSGVWPVRPRRLDTADYLYLSLASAVWAASALLAP